MLWQQKNTLRCFSGAEGGICSAWAGLCWLMRYHAGAKKLAAGDVITLVPTITTATDLTADGGTSATLTVVRIA